MINPNTYTSPLLQVLQDLATCVPGFAGAAALDHFVGRFPKAVTHFAPGSYDSFLRPRTSIPNLFAAGDWVVDAHGSFSQEKARPAPGFVGP